MYRYLVIIIILASACKPGLIPTGSSSRSVSTASIDTDSISMHLPGYSLSVEPFGLPIRIDSIYEEGLRSFIYDSISIIGVGDIMMGTNYPSNAYLPPNEGKDLLKPVSDWLRNADLTFGNLEGVILNDGGNPKNCRNPETCYIFRSPENYIQHLIDAGFDVLSTANNHVNDFGYVGRQNTARVLTDYHVPFAGFNTHPSVIFEENGVTYGFAAFAPHSGTMSFFDTQTASKIVAELKSKTDIVIVSFHAGAEGRDHQHVPKKTETFLGANRGDVYRFSRLMIDAGADVIFGHGPHVTRAVDLYKGRFIAYSLGNFCTYRRFNLSGVNGYAPAIKVYTNLLGEFQKADVLSIVQYRPGGPIPDPNHNAFKLIEKLTRSDIPESNLKFEGNSIYPGSN